MRPSARPHAAQVFKKVGFIGLGQMGEPMALALLRHGHQVVGLDPGPTRPELEEAGLTFARSPQALSDREVVCVCVYDDEQLRSAMLGANGVLASLSPGTVVTTHTTGSPHLVQELADRAPEGVHVLDATFSGTADQALSGELTLMVGGSIEALETVRPVLSAFANSIVHVGDVGSGQRMKLINNTLFAAHVVLATEALRIAKVEGFDRETFVRTIATSSGASYALDILGRDDDVEQTLRHLRHYLDKDVDAARATASEAAIDLGLLGRLVERFGREMP